MFPNLFPIGGSRITEVFLGNPDTLDKPDLIKLLSGLFSVHWSAEKKCQMLENEFNFPETNSLREEIESMCNFSEGYYEMGKTDSRREDLIHLMNEFDLSIQQALYVLHVPEEDHQLYENLVLHAPHAG